MRPFFQLCLASSSLLALAACGPSRLSDTDITRLCTLTVRCSGGAVSQIACESAVTAQRDAANASGCGGQFGAVGRCAIRADECVSGGVPEDCVDEQMRLTTCQSRPRDTGPGVDAGRIEGFPDANLECAPSAEEFGFEQCSDRCDNDGNGAFDCNDEACCGSVECAAGTVCGGGSCPSASFEEGTTYCSDGCDNDGNGVFDCNDENCCASIECASGTVCGAGSCTAGEEYGTTYCSDGCDNDGDDVFDCNDSDCCSSLAGSCGAGTLCGVPGEPSDLRTTSGYLEVYYLGEWRAVCDDYFDMNAANVACRQMGYSGATSFSSTTGGSTFWLDDVTCTGSESTLDECSHLPWGEDNCGSTECIALVCF